MAEPVNASRRDRLKEFFRRLAEAPPALDHEEAMRQVTDILNRVEDEMTSIPYDPAFPLNDGRMYPPQPDSKKAVSGRPEVTRYRSRGHSTLISDKGAMQVIDHASNEVVFSKPGAGGHSL